MKNLLKYFKGYVKEAIFGPLFKLLEACFELMVPLLIAKIVDDIIPHSNQQLLIAMILLLFLFAGLGVTVAITAQYFSSKAAIRFTQKMTNDLFAKVMFLPKSQRDSISSSSLITRLSSDAMQIQTGINLFLRLFLRAPIIVLGAIIMAYTISPQITLYFVAMVIGLTLVVVGIAAVSAPAYLNLRKLLDQMVNTTREQMSGMRVIRAFNQQNREITEFSDLNQAYLTKQLGVGRLATLVTPLTFIMVNTTLLIVIWQGSTAISNHTLKQGMLVALINYLLQILAELIKAALLVNNLNQSFVAANRIADIFAQSEEDLDAALPQGLRPQTNVVLAVKDVSFTHPGASQPSLLDLNFTVEKGQFLGIIGGTGAGKSTLIELIGQLYPISQGQLTLYQDGQSPKTLRAWRRAIAIVPQKAQLFQGTIRSNLTLGMEDTPSDKQIWHALDLAQAKAFVMNKEAGLDSPVEAFGRNFSGGQRQRLTIARALLRQAELLILDDATSALDYLTEAKLLEAIRVNQPEITLIMVSQRTNSLKSAQQILLLNHGRQAGLGHHQDLLMSNAIYQEIHASQHTEGEGVRG